MYVCMYVCMYCGFSVASKKSLLNADLQRFFFPCLLLEFLQFETLHLDLSYILIKILHILLLEKKKKRHGYSAFPGSFIEKTTLSTELALQLLQTQLFLCVWVYFWTHFIPTDLFSNSMIIARLLFFFFFPAAPVAHGSFQDRGRIGAAATTHTTACSNARSLTH